MRTLRSPWHWWMVRSFSFLFFFLSSSLFFSSHVLIFLISAGGWWATHSGICQNDAKGSTHWNAANSSQMVSNLTFIIELTLYPLYLFFTCYLFSFSSLTYMCRAGAIRTDDSCIVLKVRLFPGALAPPFIISLVILYQLYSPAPPHPPIMTFHCSSRPFRASCGCAVKSICSRKGWMVQRRWPISWSLT